MVRIVKTLSNCRASMSPSMAAPLLLCWLLQSLGAIAGQIQVSPAALDFGPRIYATSTDLTVTISNIGVTPLQVTGLASNHDNFDILLPALPLSLAPGASRDITVTFVPTAVATWHAQLLITSDDSDTSAYPLDLQGEGISLAGCGGDPAPTVNLDVSPRNVAFGNVTRGQSQQRAVVIENTGDAPLEITALATSNPQYTLLSPQPPLVIPEGNSQTVTIAFSPTALGPDNGELQIASTDSDEGLITVGLAGNGTLDTLLSAGAPTGDAFYQIPQPLSGSNGTVYWADEIQPASNGRIWKILYHSQDINGTAIAVSGWLAIPNGNSPGGGYPILSFAHGTTGMADFCAPTRRSTPASTIALLERFLAQDYIVVATDYQGLGTPGTHHYLVGPSEAYSVLDAARAARNVAYGSTDVVIFGHSQGGQAAVFSNELAATYAPELNIVGTISSGTAISGTAIIEAVKTSPYKGYLVMAAVAQNAAYGDSVSPLSRWLTPYGIQSAAALDAICIDQLSATYGPLTSSQLFVPGAPLPPSGGQHDIDADTSAGLRVGASPLLLIHGRHDSQIPASLLPGWATATCQLGQPVELQWFNTGHRVPYEAPSSTANIIFDWLGERFAGQPPPNGCSMPQP